MKTNIEYTVVKNIPTGRIRGRINLKGNPPCSHSSQSENKMFDRANNEPTVAIVVNSFGSTSVVSLCAPRKLTVQLILFALIYSVSKLNQFS